MDRTVVIDMKVERDSVCFFGFTRPGALEGSQKSERMLALEAWVWMYTNELDAYHFSMMIRLGREIRSKRILQTFDVEFARLPNLTVLHQNYFQIKTSLDDWNYI